MYGVTNLDQAVGDGQLHYGLGILYPGRVGREYFMTCGHLHASRPAAEVYICLQGQGMLNQDVIVIRMTVEPAQRLSLRSHSDRSELWVVLDEGAEISVDDQVIPPRRMEEIWVPVGAKHRLTSLGPEVRVPEVAFGNWQQADIVRYADDYQRPEQGEWGR